MPDHQEQPGWVTFLQALALLLVLLWVARLAGYAAVMSWNLTSSPARRYFRVLPYCWLSAFFGLLLAFACGWYWIFHDTYPGVAHWWPVPLLIVIAIARFDTIGYHEFRRRQDAASAQ